MILQKHSIVKAAALVFGFWFLVTTSISLLSGWFDGTAFLVRVSVLLICTCLGGFFAYASIFFSRRENEARMKNIPVRGMSSTLGETFNFLPKLPKLEHPLSDRDIHHFEAPEISLLRKEVGKNENVEFLDVWRKKCIEKGVEYLPYVALFDEMLQLMAHPQHIKIPASPVAAGGRNHGKRSVLTHSMLVSQLMLFRSKEFVEMYEPDVSSYKLLKNPNYRFNADDPLIPLIGLAHDLGKLESWKYDEAGNVIGVKYRHAQRSAMVLTRLESFWHPALDHSVIDIVKEGESKNPNENDRNFLSMLASCHHDIAAIPHMFAKNKEFWTGKLNKQQKDAGNLPAIISDRLHALMQLLYLCDKEASWIENQSNSQPMKVNHKFVGKLKQEWRNAQRVLDDEITSGISVINNYTQDGREFWQILYSAVTSEYFIKKDSEAMSRSPLTYSEVLDASGKYIKNAEGENQRYLFISMAALIEYISDQKVVSTQNLQNEYPDEYNAILNGFYDFKYPNEIGREESAGNILLDIAKITSIKNANNVNPEKGKLGGYVVSIGLYGKSAISNKDGGFKSLSEAKSDTDKTTVRSSTHMVCINLDVLKEKGIPIKDLSKIHKSNLVVFVTNYSFGVLAASQSTQTLTEDEKDNLIENLLERDTLRRQKNIGKKFDKKKDGNIGKNTPDTAALKNENNKGCALSVAKRNLQKIMTLVEEKAGGSFFEDDAGKVFGYGFKAGINNGKLVVACADTGFFLNVFGLEISLKFQNDKTTHMEILSKEREKALSVCASNFSTSGRINIGFSLKERDDV